jgi:hypothetical protein
VYNLGGDIMATKKELKIWAVEALQKNGGSLRLIDMCKYVWENHEEELKDSGDLFYTWQYDIRWAATTLREEGILLPADESPRGIWELVKH